MLTMEMNARLAILLVVTIYGATHINANLEQVCEHQTLSLSCPSGSLIHVSKANYGRTSGSGICGNINTNCASANSYDIVSNLCDGETTCSISASNSVFGDPCVGTYKYLEVEFTCRTQPACENTHTCEHTGSVDLSCPSSWQVLYICDAMYGRKVPGSVLCPSSNIYTTDCEASSSLARVREYCQGKQSCSVPAANSVFSDPCVYTVKYLEVDYICASRAVACEHNSVQICCPYGATIATLAATYGRQEGADFCTNNGVPANDCRAASSLSVVKNQCDGQNSCTVSASNGVFGDPCVGTYKYLEVIYQCV